MTSKSAVFRPKGRREEGQTIVEYLLMTAMLLFLFTGLYSMLSKKLAEVFEKAGIAILSTYY